MADKESVDIAAVWAEIEQWWKANNATITIKQLVRGASAKELKSLDAAFGFDVPKDLVASLKLHNGESVIDEYALMDVSLILRRLGQMPDFEGKPLAPDRDRKVKPLIWSTGWLPFAEESGGNMFCIDLDPGPKGKSGQVILWDQDARSAGHTSYDSFGAWLSAYRDDLIASKFTVDGKGFVDRKLRNAP